MMTDEQLEDFWTEQEDAPFWLVAPTSHEDLMQRLEALTAVVLGMAEVYDTDEGHRDMRVQCAVALALGQVQHGHAERGQVQRVEDAWNAVVGFLEAQR